MSDNALDQAALAQGRNFVWHELYVADLDKAVEFYESALGFGSTEMDMGGGNRYRMLTRNGTPICGMMSTTNLPGAPAVPPHWATYLSVEDVDASLTSVKEHGGTVVVEPIDIPTVGRMALIHDPQGAHIWLFKSAPR
jgi:predicted enzyme related to lactoylglutathione lyase